jgi:hypothetical protein
MNDKYERNSHENHLKNSIREKLTEIINNDEESYYEKAELHDVTIEYTKLQLQLEQEQLTIKHEHEENGVKPTQAKEKAKLETLPEQEKLLSLEHQINKLKYVVEYRKMLRKRYYAQLDFMMLQYQQEVEDCVGVCNCSG